MCWCCQSRYLLLWSTIACFWNHILVERLINAMLVVLLPKLWFWIENRDWHKCFWMSSWGSPLLDPKKLQNQQFYMIDWIRKKTPGQSCQSGYLLPWWLWCTIGSLGTLRKCYVSSRLGLTTLENNSARPEDFDPKTGTETCQLFLGQCVKKVAMHSPGKRRYKVDMLVDTWNGSLRHVCSRECSWFSFLFEQGGLATINQYTGHLDIIYVVICSHNVVYMSIYTLYIFCLPQTLECEGVCHSSHSGPVQVMYADPTYEIWKLRLDKRRRYLELQAETWIAATSASGRNQHSQTLGIHWCHLYRSFSV